MPKISYIKTKTVIRPMRTTFATSLGSKTAATSVIVTVTCSDGSTGIGEVPTSFVVPHETVPAIKSILKEASILLIGKNIDCWDTLTNGLRTSYPHFSMTLSGLEVALFRAYLNSQGQSESAFWGNKAKSITTDITIPFAPDFTSLDSWIQRAIQTGFLNYKIKVSGTINTDLSLVGGIHRRLTDSGKPFIIRLDGNQGFTAKSALTLLEKLDKAAIPVELFEQPLKRADYKGLKALCRDCPVPVIADETVFSSDDCKRVIDDRLAHGVNIKIAKSGILESRRILKLAKQAKLKLMIGCMTETIIGLSAAIHMAAGTNAFDYIDLDSIHFLRRRTGCNDITIAGHTYYIGKPR